MNNYRIFVIRITAIVFSVVIILWLFLEFAICQINEEYTGSDIVTNRIIDGDNILYGSVLQDDVSTIKLQVLKSSRPQIIAVGTSRVMQFRGPFFCESFYNTGGCIGNLKQMESFIDMIYDIYEPKIIILGIDWDFFNDNWSDINLEKKYKSDFKNKFKQKLYLHSRILNELLHNNNVRQAFVFPGNNDKTFLGYDDGDTIGYAAKSIRSGFRNDGSYMYGNIILGKMKTDAGIENTLNRVNEGKHRFDTTDKLSNNELLRFNVILDKIKYHNTNIIVVLPPFANSVYSRMLEIESQRNYILTFEKTICDICTSKNIECYDFSNVAWVDSSDKECLDGFHGSEKTYARMLLKIHSNSSMKNIINAKCIINGLKHPIDDWHVLPYGKCW